jgi:Replication factor C C-terminal domain
LESPHLTQSQKSQMALSIGQCEKSLVDGADEELQLLKLISSAC